jgi:glycosyltransferase involved in cell wall biosynthesis
MKIQLREPHYEMVRRNKARLSPTKPRFSVIVPCFNEQEAIVDTLQSLRENLAGLSDYELIVINDGSTDGTAALVSELAGQDDDLLVVTHDRNRGYGASLKTGIRHATSDWIAITDADGTYPNERLADLVALTERFDMVVGSRTAPGAKYPFLRRIPKYFLRVYASWLAREPIPDLNSGMRVFRKDLAEQFLNVLPDGFSFTTTITLALLTNRYRVFYLPISYTQRIGKSKIQPIRDTLRFFQLIVRTGVYFAPLRFFAPFIALLTAAFSCAFAYDVFFLRNLTDKTLILFMFTMNTMFFALLADMIDKRSGR